MWEREAGCRVFIKGATSIGPGRRAAAAAAVTEVAEAVFIVTYRGMGLSERASGHC